MLCHVGDHLPFNDREHFDLRLRLQPEVSILFFASEPVLHVVQVFSAVESSVPKNGLSCRFSQSGVQESLLEIFVVDLQIAIALPEENSISCAHGLRQDEANVDENRDALLHNLHVHLLVIAIFLDFDKDRLSDSTLQLVEHFGFEDFEAPLTNHGQVSVFQEVAVEVVEAAVQTFGEHREVGPLAY